MENVWMQIFEQRAALFFSNQEAGTTYNVSGQLHSNNSSNLEYSWLMNNHHVEKKLQNPFQSSSVE